MKRAVAAAIAAAVFTGCVSVDEAPKLIPGDTNFYLVESDYNTGILGSIGKNYAPLKSSIDNDAKIVLQDSALYILEQSTPDLLKLTTSGTVLYQQKLAAGSYPHDVVTVSSSKGYICYNGKSGADYISIFNPSTGALTGTISLAAYVHDAITTNATKMILVGTDLYVACQMRNGYAPGEGSLILKIDTNRDVVVDTIRCAYKNVVDMEYANGNLIVTNMGGYFAVDGGVEQINLSSKAVTTLVTGASLGADIQEIAYDETRHEYYGSIFKDVDIAPIVSFNSQFKPIDTIPEVIHSMALQFDQSKGKLYFAEVGTKAKAAVVTYDPSTKTKTSVETTLPVRSMAFSTAMVEAK